MPIWKRTMECSCGNIEDRDVDASFVIRDRSDIYQKLKDDILKRNVTPATGGGACKNS
jgi:transposase